MFNEENTVEQLLIDSLCKMDLPVLPDALFAFYSTGKCWRFVAPENLPRSLDQVLVEPWLHDALLRLNPEIAAQPERADTVFYHLKAILMSVAGRRSCALQ